MSVTKDFKPYSVHGPLSGSIKKKKEINLPMCTKIKFSRPIESVLVIKLYQNQYVESFKYFFLFILS